ncbi:hypothetical protein L249_3947 [Ophiocordyceps polyrhachis-furcata BCC 54312]|uniref:MAGE domain-containing protein n=1 Tax=Ophiocordyceps polyrhachis-furcata BCC 54312 TaxID=1330021 RepID=A0A367L511_9HYPO|nr:hypothetical protein L249_3947 [Ophiocordyceps polyrhachis-furcata BCC 54312]
MPPSQRRRRPTDDDDPEEDARPRQRQNRNPSDDEPDDDDAGSEDSSEPDNGDASHEAEIRLVKKMVRYVISCEYSRTTIRREGIKERVLGNQGRSFRKVLGLAQEQLRAIWGMELRELPVREKMTLHEKRKAMKSSSQAKTGSGSYILTSTLPVAFRSATILRPSKTPSEEEEATYAAFYTLVLSLIWLNSGELSDQKLKRYLLRLNADQNVADEKTENTLKRMEKQGYVVKRVERPPVGHDGEHLTTWHVGPRAKEEVGLDGVMGMVRQVYGSEWSPEIETKLHLSLGVKKGRAAAAGGGGGGGSASENRVGSELDE